MSSERAIKKSVSQSVSQSVIEKQVLVIRTEFKLIWCKIE